MEYEPRCGLCLKKLTSDTNAKQLPCSHVYCSPCLEIDEETTCPTCRQSWSGFAINDLKSFPNVAGMKGDPMKSMFCRLCGTEAKKLSTVYCVGCAKTFCEEHEMEHDERFDLEHDKVSISTYMKSPARYRKTECKLHSSEITVACELCHLVFCKECDQNAECIVEFKARGLHQFVNVTEFIVEVEEKLRKKLESLSEKKADISKAEETTWRKVIDTENRVERWKDQVDDIIKQKMQHLTMIGDSFKEQLDTYSAQVEDEAAGFTADLGTEGAQLINMESELSEALSTDTDVFKLVELFKLAFIELTPTAEVSVAQKSIQFTGYQPVFSLVSFSPSGLEYKWQKLTAETVISIAAMDNGNILVGTASNHLEVRNLYFRVLFREQVPGNLIDVAASNSNAACLLDDGSRATIFILSNQLKNAMVVCTWLTANPGQNHLAGFGNTLMAYDGEIAVWDIVANRAYWRKNLPENNCPPYSLCVASKNAALVLSSRGVENRSGFGERLLHDWTRFTDDEANQSSLTYDSFSEQEPRTIAASSSAGMSLHRLSMTRDHSSNFYICGENGITAFKHDGNRTGDLRKLTHPELSNVKNVTAIAACGNQLVVGCGEEGLKLFSVL